MNVGTILVCILTLSLVAVIPQAFAQSENLLYGTSSFENVPPSIIPGKPTTFDIKFQYTTGPYAISNFSPVIDVNPDSATSKVRIELQSLESLTQRQIARIPVTITVDPSIEHEKIFLSVFFTGQHFISDESYKSAWTDSVTLEISPKDVIAILLGECDTIDVESSVTSGSILGICKSEKENSVIVMVDAISNGSLTVSLPKDMIYSLTSIDCKTTNDFFILIDGEEVISTVTATETENIVTVDYTEGVHKIEIVGTSIIPSPAPYQYCGIVMGYDSQFLPPKFQERNGMSLQQIRCNDDLEVLVRYDYSPACVKQETKMRLIERSWGGHDIPKEEEKEELVDLGEKGEFSIEYWLEGANLQSIIADPDATALNVELSDSGYGILQITIPRNVIDAKIGIYDDDFFVLVDRESVPYVETSNDFQRTLTIKFQKDSKLIEIIGTNPDF